MQTDARVKEVK